MRAICRGFPVLKTLQEFPAKATAIALYLSAVRRLLKKTKGYECQEADCTFMLAFDGPADAAHFCLLVCISVCSGGRCGNLNDGWLASTVWSGGGGGEGSQSGGIMDSWQWDHEGGGGLILPV